MATGWATSISQTIHTPLFQPPSPLLLLYVHTWYRSARSSAHRPRRMFCIYVNTLYVYVAGPGIAAKVVVVARIFVRNAPLGEPFRVLTKEAAEKVGVSAKRRPKVDGLRVFYDRNPPWRKRAAERKIKQVKRRSPCTKGLLGKQEQLMRGRTGSRTPEYRIPPGVCCCRKGFGFRAPSSPLMSTPHTPNPLINLLHRNLLHPLPLLRLRICLCLVCDFVCKNFEHTVKEQSSHTKREENWGGFRVRRLCPPGRILLIQRRTVRQLSLEIPRFRYLSPLSWLETFLSGSDSPRA